MKLKIMTTFLFVIFFLVGCQPTIEEPVFHTVSFETNSELVIESISIEHGNLVEEPSIPVREGYTFLGWFGDVNLTSPFDFENLVTDNLTIYLKWEVQEIPISTLIQQDIDAIDWLSDPLNSVKIELPTRGSINASSIRWRSSDQNMINQKGYIFYPTRVEDEKTVTLTAEFSLSGQKLTKEFDIFVTVKPPVVIDRSVDLPFTNLTSEYEVLETTIQTFYPQNGGLPYVDIQQFLMSLNGLIDADDLESIMDGHLLTISYTAEYSILDDQGNVESTEYETYEMIIDFNENTLTVDSLSFFSGYVKSTETDYSKGLTYLETYIEEGESVTFRFNDYRLDILQHQEGDKEYYLFPFHLANILFTSGSYYNVYYNGDGYYGVYAFPSSSDPSGDTEDGRAFNTIKLSSLNSTVIDDDVLMATYDMLVFTLDYFYGLKAYQNVTTYYNSLETIKNTMITGQVRDLSNGLFYVINQVLDDLHARYHFPGYYEPSNFLIPLTSIQQLGPRVKSWYTVFWQMQDVHAITYRNSNNTPPNYRFIDDNRTAIIYLDSFDTATTEDLNRPDSDRYMSETMELIFSKNPDVENIVIDISYNRGGNLGALLRVLGYMTNQPIRMSFQNPLDKRNETYFIDVETNAYEHINWFILTSKVTFSAANLMTSIAKDMRFASIIGTKTGGGASSIIPVVLPDGTFFHMSSLNVLSYRIGNELEGYEYISIENGVTPDFILPLSDTQNPSKIIDVISRATSGN